MTSIALNFINNSNDTNPNGVVIFQQNISPTGSLVQSLPVAWQVIQNWQKGDSYPLSVAIDLTVAASDNFGNNTPVQPAANGNRFDMISSPTGNLLHLSSALATGPQVEVHNELPTGSINAMVFRNGLLLAEKTNVAPGQAAGFAFEPTLCVRLMSQIEQGQIINNMPLSDINFQFSLMGISSADVVMTGGGSGSGAQPLQFSLQNVKMA